MYSQVCASPSVPYVQLNVLLPDEVADEAEAKELLSVAGQA